MVELVEVVGMEGGGLGPAGMSRGMELTAAMWVATEVFLARALELTNQVPGFFDHCDSWI